MILTNTEQRKIKMKLFISTGGKGTRLYPLTKEVPKPMVILAGKPMLHHLVDWAKKYSIEEVVMLNGYMADKIIDYFGDGAKFGIKITHSNEPYALDSGGAIKFAERHIDGTFVYISGDHICEVDLNKMLEYHRRNNASMTVFAHKSTHPNDADILQVNESNQVIKFISKHDDHTGVGNLSNSGLCIIESEVVKLMDKEIFNFENYIYPRALNNGLKIMSYITDEFIADMGTIERLKKCEEHILKST